VKKMKKTIPLAIFLCAFLLIASNAHAAPVGDHIDLGGTATGYLAIQNAKNSSTQNGIEGKNPDGTHNPNHNGLPDYPNFQIPAGYTNAGVWSAVIASPQSTASDYATDFSNTFYGGTSLTVNNQTITQPDFATMSAGYIDYDDGLVSSTGVSTVPVSALTFNFNTYEWDGIVGPSNDPRTSWDVGAAYDISPFSPVDTPYNAGSGAGNAQFFYQISISNVTGSGLTFTDGVLTSMDIQGDILIELYVAPYPTSGNASYTGTFNASGLDYAFDVTGTDSAGIFSGINLIMNRAGTASTASAEAVPAMSAFVWWIGSGLLGLCGLLGVRRIRAAGNA
jgi:hypothetical protein